MTGCAMAIRYTGQIEYQNGIPEVIGRTSDGSMTVTGGSIAEIGAERTVTLGYRAGSSGTLTVQGEGSTVRFDARHNFTNHLDLGDDGRGEIFVRNGGRLEFVSAEMASNVILDVSDSDDSRLAVDSGTVFLSGLGANLLASGSDVHTGVHLSNASEMHLQAARISNVAIKTSNALEITSGSTLIVETVHAEGPVNGATFSKVEIDEVNGMAEAVIDDSDLLVRTVAGTATVEIAVDRQLGSPHPTHAGSLIVRNESVVEISASMDLVNATAELAIGHGKEAEATFSLTDSALNMSGYDVDLSIGALSATGLFDIEASEVSLVATHEVTILLGLTALHGGRGLAEVTLDDRSTFDVEAEDVRLGIIANGDTEATFRVAGGSVVTMNGAGESLHDNTLSIHGYSEGEATLLVEDNGSSLSTGFLSVGRQFASSTIDWNGTLAVRRGGQVDAKHVLINHGGTLHLSNGTLISTGFQDYHSVIGFDDATLLVSGSSQSTLSADRIEVGESDIDFSVRNGRAPTLHIDSQSVTLSSSALTVTGRQDDFTQGDEFTLIESDVGTLRGLYSNQVGLTLSAENTNGSAHAGFEYAFFDRLDSTHTFGFIALTNGDGTGSSDLRFDRTSADSVDFTYDGVAGVGEGGGFDHIETTRLDRVFGSNANDRISANGDDAIKLHGRSGNDSLEGGAGADLLSGGQGHDRLLGGGGDDRLAGHDGNDRLIGGEGNDRLIAGAGDDRLIGNEGNDRLFGQSGADSFVFRKGFDRDTVFDFEGGTDRLLLDDNLWTGTLSKAEVLDTYGRETGTATVLDFGGGDIVRINNVQLADLLDDMVII